MEEDYAILRLKLVETVPAYELSRLTCIINDIYDIFLEIENANHYTRLSPISLPSDDTKLYIKKASIGTPNRIEFLGIGKHLLNTVNFLGENFNTILTVEQANILNVDKSDTIFDYMKRIKEVDETKSLQENVKETERLSNNLKSLEEEIIKLKKNSKWDELKNQEKKEYINYVKYIGGISRNIITQAEITIIKSVPVG